VNTTWIAVRRVVISPFAVSTRDIAGRTVQLVARVTRVDGTITVLTAVKTDLSVLYVAWLHHARSCTPSSGRLQLTEISFNFYGPGNFCVKCR